MTNKYKVPQKKWHRWSKKAREVFNTLYYTMTHNQKVIVATKQREIPKDSWRILSWNAAWLAADAVNEK